MSKESLKNLIKNVDSQLFDIVNNLICSICQELFNKPVTTPCGHSFCNGCIKRVLSSKNNSGCPLCKNPVKRYGLKAAEVKLKFSDICKELPLAFEQDVKDLTMDMLDFGEDLAKSSKLSQLYNQENVKELKTKKHKSAAAKRASKKITDAVQSGNESDSFCPVLKRGKNVQEYASAKKKRMEDLVSISQTEPTSHSSLGESFEVNKKLEKIEKIPPEEKINEWFNAVGDNIFINSPGFSILETSSKNESDSEKKEEKPTMIRKDYIKSSISSKNEADSLKTVRDPYEFIPSQNKKVFKKKRQKRSTGKKIPDFKALQSFSRESIKRSTILLNTSKEEMDREEETKELSTENQITASQKFDKLLQETKEEPKKSHALYLPSQSSSPKFLDVSFHSKLDSPKTSSKVRKKLPAEEELLFKDIESPRKGKQERSSVRPKRKRSSDAMKNDKKQKLHTELEMKSEISYSGNLVKKCPPDNLKKNDFPSTKLGELLKELIDDDIIYATRPINAPVRLPEIIGRPQNEEPDVAITQSTELIGFCIQQDCPNEKNFKQIVDNMEKELNLIEKLIEDPKPSRDCPTPGGKDPTVNSLLSSVKIDGSESTLNKNSCVEFLHLGKLTPMRKRAKSTVVKVVFPIGLSSLARRHVLQTSFQPVQTPRKQPRQVSTGIQTSEDQRVSCLVQTSQVLHFSTAIQTSQEIKPSVEIQTTQKCNASTEIQTSQRLVCQEIQTTQIEYDSAQVQTTQPSISRKENPQSTETPLRKPSHQHRKIIKRKSFHDSCSLFPFSAAEEQNPIEKEVIMDFDLEEEFDKTWKKTQKHNHLVELKNEKNLQRNEKLLFNNQNAVDVDSDDSDILPPRRRNSFRILSHDSVGVLEEYETRQKIPLDVRMGSPEVEMEVIQLDTPQTQNSEEQMMRVLKNIDLDIPKSKTAAKGEKSEESDSDFFVEQTPPRPSSRTAEGRNLSRSRAGADFTQKQSPRGCAKNDNLDGIDLIGDSLPKGFSDSFLLPSAPKKMSATPETNTRDEVQKMNLKIQPTIDLPNENDQNQMNAFEDRKPPETKAFQLKTVIDTWRRGDVSSPVKVTPQKKLCVLASSVKNPDLIKKFTNKFKAEFLSKPSKDMTHLIVGLHENEEKELLPLCTPKLLFAMANKKWVVNELWVESCLKANMILPEETFETLDPVGGQGCRNSRTSSEKLLKICEIFLLGDFQMISKEEFADLIVDSGGTLVSSPERFSFLPSKLRMIIADRDCLKLSEKQLIDLYEKHSTVILSRDVIIMSIQSYQLPNFSPYYLHPVSEENLIKLGYPSLLVRHEEEEEEEYSTNSTR